jgi:hypothetical protein
MNTRTRSTRTFFILLAILAVAAVLNAFLPQGELGTQMPESQIPTWQLALGSAGMTAVSFVTG